MPLWSGRLHLAVGAARMRGDGSLVLGLSPEPAIVWRHQTDEIVPAVLNAYSGRVVPWGLATTGPYQRDGLSLASLAHPTSSGLLPDGLVVGERRPALASLVFHLANFPGYVGEPLTRDGMTWAGRTVFAWDGWSVDLDQAPHESALRSELRSTHGYALTHVGRLRRQDGRSFRAAEALRCIGALHYLFGFVRGGWCGPALMVGQDDRDDVVWQHWSVMLVDSGKHRPSIFIGLDPGVLARLAPGFMKRVTGPAWGESYRRAVAFYVAANRGVPIEIGITLAQSALELLAWSTFVRSGRVTPADFERWPAARRLRELLSRARIPLTTPPTLAALASLSGVGAPGDGPERVAYVRNRIVHPPRNRTLRKLSSAELVDAWRLMLYYADVVVLRLARYSGEIRSRIDDKPSVVRW